MKGPILLIGGMGPQASVEGHRRMITTAMTDYSAIDNEDYPEIVHLSVPVPDFISDESAKSAAQAMLLDRLRKAEKFKPVVAMMACNTAHLLFDDFVKSTKLPLVSLIEQVTKRMSQKGVKRAILLASPVTIGSGLYQESLSRENIICKVPARVIQSKLESVIRSVIQGDSERYQRYLRQLCNEYLKEYDVVILGCTELPVAYGKIDDSRIIDSLQVLCDTSLEAYYNNQL